jgi:hypothetical protein
MKQFREIGDKVRVWNGFEERFNNGHITATGGHGSTLYQVLQYNEAKSQWWHHEDNVLDRDEK